MENEKQQDQAEEQVDAVEEALEPAPKPARKKASKPKPRMVEVRVIKAQAGSALVEWMDDEGMYRRGHLPATSVIEGTADLNELEKAAPYGLPFETFIEVTATPERIANDLRKRGVWTFEDLSKMSAVMKANRAFDLPAFMQNAKKEAGK